MQTTLSAHQQTTTHPPQPNETVEFQVRRVGLADRLALHLGVALIAWSRRPLSYETRERRALHHEMYLARLERERAAERLLHTTVMLQR